MAKDKNLLTKLFHTISFNLKPNKQHYLVTVSIVSLLLTACSTAPRSPMQIKVGDYNYAVEYLTWQIEQEMDSSNITGLSIALVDDQEIIWSKGFGFADKALKSKATPNTIFRTGSISKIFNVIAAMQLSEKGAMDIDQPLKTYLPSFKINSRFGSTDKITPRTIMTHHSGLPSDWAEGLWEDNPKDFTEVVEYLKDEYTAYPPNYVESYSNLAHTLLGHAIEIQTDTDYADHLINSVLSPMGMRHSFFAQGLSGPLAAKGYANGKLTTETSLRDIPAGGLNSSVTELSQLVKLVNGQGIVDQQQILSARSMRAMQTAQNTEIPLDLSQRIGLGWFFKDAVFNDKELVVWHGGGTRNHRSILAVMPERQLGVVILSNSATAYEAIDRIADKSLQLLLEGKTGQKFADEKSKNGELTQEPTLAKKLEGYYSTSLGLVKVLDDSDQLKAKIGKQTLHLRQQDNGRYYLEYRLLGFIPIKLGKLSQMGLSLRSIEGRDILVATDRNNQSVLAGEKLKPVAIPDAWVKRLGEYKIINPLDIVTFEKLELSVKEGFLVSQLIFKEGGSQINALMPVNNSEAIRAGLGRSFGETVRVIEDAGEEQLTYSGMLFRKLPNN